MALMKSIKKTQDGFSGELVAEDAYWKVDTMTGDKNSIEFFVIALKDDVLLEKRKFQFTPSVADGSKNFIAQAYLFLKSIPEFSQAKDC